MAEVLSENEKHLFASLAAYSALENPKIRAQAIKMSLYEDADPEKFTEAAAAGISDLDTQIMAENVNAALRIINNLHEARPQLFATLLRGFADSADEDELAKTARWLVPELVSSFKTLAPAVMPSLINGFCEMVETDHSGQMKKSHRQPESCDDGRWRCKMMNGWKEIVSTNENCVRHKWKEAARRHRLPVHLCSR
jgi:hypothetical protein